MLLAVSALAASSLIGLASGHLRIAATLGVVGLIVVAAMGARRSRWVATYRPALASIALAAVATLTMSAPFQPDGQIDPGTVFESRVSTRPPDNRLPYRSVQFILNGLDPVETQYFIDWAITDRTQLASAAVATVVSALGVQVPPDQLWYLPAEEIEWRAVDAHGYWAVRAAMIALNAMLPIGIAALGTVWFGRRIGELAALVGLLSVFSFVEALFTWPKTFGATCAAVAVALIGARRDVLGGVGLGLAYLVHPTALVLLPVGVLFIAARTDRRMRSLAVVLASAALVVLPWMAWVSLVLERSSRMVLYPIGWILTTPDSLSDELGAAIRHFTGRFPFGFLADRFTSIRDSLDPVGLFQALNDRDRLRLTLFYDTTLIGMLGVVGVAIIGYGFGMVRRMRTLPDVRWAIGAQLGLATLLWGVWPRALGRELLQPMIPVLAIALALGLVANRRTPVLALPKAVETFIVLNLTLLVGGPGGPETFIARISVAALMALLAVWTLREARDGRSALSDEAGALQLGSPEPSSDRSSGDTRR